MTDWTIGDRVAAFWYVYWNETPGAMLKFAGHEVALTPDAVVMIPPYTLYSTELAAPVSGHHFIQFSAGAPFREVKREPLIFDAAALGGYFREPPPASRALDAMRLYRFVFKLLLLVPDEFLCASAQSALDPRIVQVLDYLGTLQNNKFSNREASRLAGMSPSNFSHLFRSVTGVSPQRYQLRRRLELAYTMLVESKLTIGEIAEATGFADRYHFSKAFKAFYKKPPGMLRRLALLAEGQSIT